MNREFSILVRDKLVWKPYRRKKKIYFTRYRTSTLKRFKKYIDKRFASEHGEFLIKDENNKTFIRFVVMNGKMMKIYKTGPTGSRYPIWKYFKDH